MKSMKSYKDTDMDADDMGMKKAIKGKVKMTKKTVKGMVKMKKKGRR